MSQTNEPLLAPFRIIADIGQATDGWQFKGLFDAAQPTRPLIVPIVFRHLEVADYMVEGLPLHIVRQQALHFASLLRHSPEMVHKKHEKLEEMESRGGSTLVVIEGNLKEIEEVLRADSGVQVSKVTSVPWLFVPDRQTAEMMVYAVIQRALSQKRKSGAFSVLSRPNPAHHRH
jgi:hypothetical protein